MCIRILGLTEKGIRWEFEDEFLGKSLCLQYKKCSLKLPEKKAADQLGWRILPQLPLQRTQLITGAVEAANDAIGQRNSKKFKEKRRCGVTIATSLRHTKKCCWKLYEMPQNWKCSKFPEKGSQGMQAVAESRPIIETSLFSKEQLEHLYRLFNQSQPSHNSPSCSLPPKGNLRICSLYS